MPTNESGKQNMLCVYIQFLWIPANLKVLHAIIYINTIASPQAILKLNEDNQTIQFQEILKLCIHIPWYCLNIDMDHNLFYALTALFS